MSYKVNEIQISYKEKIRTIQSKPIKSSEDVAQVLFNNWDVKTIGLHESFKVLLLNNSNKVKGIYQLSTGGITGTIVDLRILFALALKTLSVAIILAHNHPSSKLQPSESDKQLTDKVVKAAKLLDIKVLDHVILTPDKKYFSFADNGLL
ncbi:MAG: JAB domain-containing protein [Flavobacteriaceae bacterium]|nr:JAB domain-containing protein [Flavobacteriaceae bacterium]